MRERAVLQAVGELLGREIDLDRLFAILVDEVTAALGADRGTLYLLDAHRGELVSRAAQLPEIAEIRIPLGVGVAGRVAQTGAPQNLSGDAARAALFPGIDAQTGYVTGSTLAVPIRDSQGRVVGVLQLLNAGAGAFSEGDAALLAQLATQAGMVLETTSLCHELQRPGGRPVLYRYNNILGDSPALLRVYRITEKAAMTAATVLICGESGTGKELFARAIHVNSQRRAQPFVKVDCAALPGGLIENELFGHERGAFTGAGAQALGKFEAADGGTLFIDEIGELPLALQGRLLRILQDRAFTRLGGTQTVEVDVRVVAATHRDLARMVEEGTFRADLYYRLKVVEMTLPPLRERGARDILRLVNHYAVMAARRHQRPVMALSAEAQGRLVAHAWPGNVRELAHCIESAVILADGPIMEGEDLPLPARGGATVAGAAPREGPGEGVALTLADAERGHILRVLALADGNQSEAARMLGIGRNTLARKLKSYGELP